MMFSCEPVDPLRQTKVIRPSVTTRILVVSGYGMIFNWERESDHRRMPKIV
jgi:hypothetical protein